MIVSGKHGLHLFTKARLLNAEAVSIDPVPMKEEGQRFASDHDDVTESGGVGPDGMFKAQGTFGEDNPKARSGRDFGHRIRR